MLEPLEQLFSSLSNFRPRGALLGVNLLWMWGHITFLNQEHRNKDLSFASFAGHDLPWLPQG